MQAYGFSVKDMTESMCVAELMKLYQEKLNNNWIVYMKDTVILDVSDVSD